MFVIKVKYGPENSQQDIRTFTVIKKIITHTKSIRYNLKPMNCKNARMAFGFVINVKYGSENNQQTLVMLKSYRKR